MTDTTSSNQSPPLPLASAKVKEPTRREFIHLTATAMGVVGVGAAAWPFLNSMNPSADVMALSSIEIDLSAIPVGETRTVLWRSKPVFVRHRPDAEIKEMRATFLKTLPDPQTDEQRTKDPNWLIVVGVCTHLGCIPTQRKSMKSGESGGWVCPCHGSVYDASGRIISGPAPRNLDVPPYEFIDKTKTLRIG